MECNVGVYSTQLYRDCNKPLYRSLLTNQDSMESRKVFFVAHVELENKPRLKRIALFRLGYLKLMAI